jgi:two-component system response regulator DesR
MGMPDRPDPTAASILAELNDAGEPAELIVAVASSDTRLLERLAHTLEADGLEVVVATADPDELMAALRHLRVDAVVCVVIGSPGQVRWVADVHELVPTSHIVVVGTHSSRGLVRRLLDAGAEGFVLKSRVDKALPLAVRAACAGQVSVPTELSRNIERPPLTFRERQILRLLVTGKSNAEIARQLFLSESTVKGHLTAVFVKLGVRTRHEAAAIASDPDAGRGLGVIEGKPNGNGSGES